MAVELGTIKFLEDSEDQAMMLHGILAEELLFPTHKRYVVWATVMAARCTDLMSLAQDVAAGLDDVSKRDIRFALNRMSVTNPYFFSRNYAQVNAGGSLDGLNLRPFDEINVNDEVGYHYACIAISMVNGGYNCFRSHVASLQQLGQNDSAIDQAMRLTSALMAMRQILFTKNHWDAE